jgi:hypothetical protein
MESRRDTLRIPNYASVVFDKDLNTYRWNGTTRYAHDFGSLFLRLDERFLSSLIRSGQDLIRDEQSVDLSVRDRLFDGIQASTKISSLSVSDNKSVTLGNTSSHAFYGGILYEPIPRVTIEPLVGLRLDNQFNQHDKGPSYLLNLSSDSLDYEGYSTRLNGMMQYDYLTPRTLEARNASLDIARLYFEQTRNALHVQYYGNRRDFYSAATTAVQQQLHVFNNIETRTEDAVTVSDSLDYSAGKNLLLSFEGSVFTREVGRATRYKLYLPGIRPTFNTTTDELKIEGGTRATYANGKTFNGTVGFFYQERNEQHSVENDDHANSIDLDEEMRMEEMKNNHSRRTSLASTLSIALSTYHSVALSGSVSLLRYDTPSAGNDDDRDELWYIFSATSDHRISRALTMTVTADLDLTHLVYLASTRSANNTWNRILRLSPRLDYTVSKEFRTINTFEVLANYTVYDIEYSLATNRSIVFRQFSFIDSSQLGLTRKLSLEFSGMLRLYERGELRWDAFTEQPVNYFEDGLFEGKLLFAADPRLIFSVGIRYFSQSRYGYDGISRNLESFLRTIGPTSTILWNAGKRTDVSFSGWFQSQSQTGESNRGIANMTMSLTVRI